MSNAPAIDVQIGLKMAILNILGYLGYQGGTGYPGWVTLAKAHIPYTHGPAAIGLNMIRRPVVELCFGN